MKPRSKLTTAKRKADNICSCTAISWFRLVAQQGALLLILMMILIFVWFVAQSQIAPLSNRRATARPLVIPNTPISSTIPPISSTVADTTGGVPPKAGVPIVTSQPGAAVISHSHSSRHVRMVDGLNGKEPMSADGGSDADDESIISHSHNHNNNNNNNENRIENRIEKRVMITTVNPSIINPFINPPTYLTDVDDDPAVIARSLGALHLELRFAPSCPQARGGYNIDPRLFDNQLSTFYDGGLSHTYGNRFGLERNVLTRQFIQGRKHARIQPLPLDEKCQAVPVIQSLAARPPTPCYKRDAPPDYYLYPIHIHLNINYTLIYYVAINIMYFNTNFKFIVQKLHIISINICLFILVWTEKMSDLFISMYLIIGD